MLNRIRADAGPWHQLAKLLPALTRAGVDATAVEAETGLERARQNVWAVSEQVSPEPYHPVTPPKPLPVWALQSGLGGRDRPGARAAERVGRVRAGAQGCLIPKS